MPDLRILRTIARDAIEQMGHVELYQFWLDESAYLLHYIAKLREPVDVSKTYVETTSSIGAAPWVSSRICRALNKVGSGRFPRWLWWWGSTQVRSHYPGWLRYLIDAKMEVAEYEDKEFPEPVYEQIVIQCAILSAKGITPKRLLIGPKANFDLASDKEYPAYVEFHRQNKIRVRASSGFYMSLYYEINEFLAEDAVLVIGDPA